MVDPEKECDEYGKTLKEIFRHKDKTLCAKCFEQYKSILSDTTDEQ